MHRIADSTAANDYTPEVCPNCAENRFDTESREQRFLYGKPGEAIELVANVPVHICRACKFEFTSEEAEEPRHEAVCQHLGVLSPRRITDLRRLYDMSRAEFAELSRVGTASLARWEAGILIQNPANDQLLYLLHFEDNVERLRNRGADGRLPTLRAVASQANEPLEVESNGRIAFAGAAISRRCSIRGQFRAIRDSEQRRAVARNWRLRVQGNG
jgi:DNA-binding transcriptional regulator YiaG